MFKNLIIPFFFLAFTINAAAQSSKAPGILVSRVDTATVDGQLLCRGARYLPAGLADSTTIRYIATRRHNSDYGTFVVGKGGLYYPIDSNARMFVAKGIKQNEGLPKDTVARSVNKRLWNGQRMEIAMTRSGYQIHVGQKIRLGRGSNPDSTFRFVRLHSTSAIHMYSEETKKRALNSLIPGGADLAGEELTIHYIFYCKAKKKAPMAYWLVHVPKGILFQIEIQIDEAFKAGEVLAPEAFSGS